MKCLSCPNESVKGKRRCWPCLKKQAFERSLAGERIFPTGETPTDKKLFEEYVRSLNEKKLQVG